MTLANASGTDRDIPAADFRAISQMPLEQAPGDDKYSTAS